MWRDKGKAHRYGLLRLLCEWSADNEDEEFRRDWEKYGARGECRICVPDVGRTFGGEN